MAKKGKSHRPQPPRVSQKPHQPTLIETVEQHPGWAVLAIFTFLVCIFFFDVLFGGKIYVSPDFQSPAALSVSLKDALWKHGIFPLWTPTIFAGMPSFASLIYTPFVYFPHIILMLLDRIISLPPMFWQVPHYPIAGMGVYLFLRDRKVELIPALFGGIAFMFTPYLITMVIFGHGSQMMTAVYLPFGLWALDRLLTRGGWLYVGITALVLGLQFQRGHVQIVYYSWLVYGGYLAYIIIEKFRSQNAKAVPVLVGRFAAVLLLALGLAAMQYLPIYEYMPYSIRGSVAALATNTTEKGVGFDYATQWSFSPGEMLTFFVPSFFGFGGQTYWGNMPFTDYPNYMGILVLLLAVFAVLYRRQRPVVFLGIVTIIALLVSFGKNAALIYKLFYNYLPFFNKFRVPVMILVLVQMCVALLAGMGLQHLLNIIKDHTTKRAGKSALSGRLLAAAAVVLALTILLTVVKDGFFNIMQSLYPDRYPPDIQSQLDSERFKMLLTDLWMVCIWVVCGLGLLAFALRGAMTRTTFALGILVITLADIWFVDYKLNKPVPAKNMDNYLQPDEIARYLAPDTTLFRIFPTANLFGENRWAAQGLQSIGGYHAAKPRVYQDFLDVTRLDSDYAQKYYRVVNHGGQQALERISDEQINRDMRQSDQNLLDFLNVKYVISPYPIPEKALIPRVQVRHKIGNQQIPVMIYENTEVMPRAFLVGKYELIPQPQTALLRLRAGDFDPRSSVILRQKPAQEPEEDSTAAAKILSYDLHQIRVHTKATKTQLLVLSDTYYPSGWQAQIDAHPAEILQANHAFRALSVSAGEHEIVLTYHSKAFVFGVWGTLASTLIIAAGLFLGYRNEKKVPQPQTAPQKN